MIGLPNHDGVAMGLRSWCRYGVPELEALVSSIVPVSGPLLLDCLPLQREWAPNLQSVAESGGAQSQGTRTPMRLGCGTKWLPPSQTFGLEVQREPENCHHMMRFDF